MKQAEPARQPTPVPAGDVEGDGRSAAPPGEPTPVLRPPPPRRAILEMAEYVPRPDLQQLADRLGRPLSSLIKLDQNENAYGCSPRVRQALAAFDGYSIYADAGQVATRRLVAEYVSVDPDSVVLGNGSDELIDLLCRVYLEAGDESIDCSPSFGMIAVSISATGATRVDVPRGPEFEIDVEGVLRAVTPRTKLIWVVTPNNPTGTPAADDVVPRLLETGRLVVVDEAYAEFTNRTYVGWVAKHPNLVVLRTFSKWAGLAGLRVGYAIVPPEVARYLWKIKAPFNVNQAAHVAVRESLADRDYLFQTVRWIIEERERMARRLAEFDFLRVYPSQTNFLLCEVTRGEALRLRDLLMEEGVVTRYFRGPRLDRCLRISVGRPSDTDALCAALRAVEGRL